MSDIVTLLKPIAAVIPVELPASVNVAVVDKAKSPLGMVMSPL